MDLGAMACLWFSGANAALGLSCLLRGEYERACFSGGVALFTLWSGVQ